MLKIFWNCFSIYSSEDFTQMCISQASLGRSGTGDIGIAWPQALEQICPHSLQARPVGSAWCPLVWPALLPAAPAGTQWGPEALSSGQKLLIWHH